MRFSPELPMSRGPEGPSRSILGLRLAGIVVTGFMVLVSATGDPGVGLSGRRPLVLVALVVFTAGVYVAIPRDALPPGRRFFALLGVAGGTVALILLQGDANATITGIYVAVILAGLRLPARQAAAVSALAIGGSCVAYLLVVENPTGPVLSVLFGVPPWFIVMRAMRGMRSRELEKEALIEQLRTSREAEARAAADAERAHLAREMHDVLAHTLSGLTVQLELARLQSRAGDPALEATITDAHTRAVAGLQEARRAIGTLRGDEVPGPDRLGELVASFEAAGRVTTRLEERGAPFALDPEARLAVYRTAQEALTNITRHACAERVLLSLDWEPGGLRLTVRDHGEGTALPVAAGAGSQSVAGPRGGGGHGLTGMSERAELAGGRLDAGPTDDGFRVELWLPR